MEIVKIENNSKFGLVVSSRVIAEKLGKRHDHILRDLEKILDEAIFEHLIDNTYCKEDCKGLCHICGTNLNISKCNCDEDHLYIDPRLEQLKTFLDD